MDIKHAAERIIIAKLKIELSRESARVYSPNRRLSDHQAIEMVGSAVFIAHVEGTAATASAISRYIGMPRPTVIRRLKDMAKSGHVVRIGRAYRINTQNINSLRHIQMTRRNVDRILTAARLLSKMDENR